MPQCLIVVATATAASLIGVITQRDVASAIGLFLLGVGFAVVYRWLREHGRF